MFGLKSRSDANAAATKRFEDDIEILRLRLTAAAQAGGGVTTLIGQSPGAGTTTLAVWLARSLARADRPTLLADGNVAHPDIHHVFQIDSAPGAVDLLAGRAKSNDVIRPTSDPNLSVLPVGTFEPSTMNSSVEAWQKQWRQLAANWFVLIDAGSVNSPSALTMADASDHVILVVECGQTKHEQIESTRKKMSLNGTPLLGVVLNQRRHVIPDAIYRRL
jgi:Mrp family chromosome partitioning ATPase